MEGTQRGQTKEQIKKRESEATSKKTLREVKESEKSTEREIPDSEGPSPDGSLEREEPRDPRLM
jgi:hypothetical protein